MNISCFIKLSFLSLLIESETSLIFRFFSGVVTMKKLHANYCCYYLFIISSLYEFYYLAFVYWLLLSSLIFVVIVYSRIIVIIFLKTYPANSQASTQTLSRRENNGLLLLFLLIIILAVHFVVYCIVLSMYKCLISYDWHLKNVTNDFPCLGYCKTHTVFLAALDFGTWGC